MMQSMNSNILILTSDTGFGHRSAARALEAAFSQVGFQVHTANPIAHTSVPGFIKETEANYDLIVKNVPELYSAAYEASNFPPATSMLESVIAVSMFEAISATLREHPADLVISVFPYYQAPLMAYFMIHQQKTPLVTVVTDLSTLQRVWFNSISDLTIVPTLKARELAIKSGLEKSKVEVIGIPVSPKLYQKEDKHQLRQKLGWQDGPITLLVVGSNRLQNVTEMLHPLNHSGLDVQLILIAGGSKSLAKEFEKTEWHLPVKRYDFVEDMSPFLHAADGVICKAGGLIVTESLAAGLPLILVNVIEGQETGNAEYVVEAGAGIRANDGAHVLETVHHWTVGGQLASVAANASGAGNPLAAAQIVERSIAVMNAGATRPRLFKPVDMSAFTKLLDNLGIKIQS
jgi:1,2-diacylglycerol 3-beta-galactosyltransferase